ncbi:MAG: hypothetical protein ACT4NY_02015 [Pseudonocardiales bacterium]
MRLAGPAASDAYSGEVTDAGPEVDDDMLRRQFQHLLALSAASAMGAPVPGVGELVDWLTAPGPPPAERRIGRGDVEMIRRCGEQLGALASAQGGQGQAATRLAEWADEWLDADCSDATRAALLTTLAHIHTVTAWCCHDVGAVARSHWHFARALELATEAHDAYQAAYAMRHAAMMLVDRDQPNNGLKIVQFSLVKLGDLDHSDPRAAVQRGECSVIAALALAKLGEGRRAHDALKAAGDGWSPPTPHAQGCMDLDGAHANLLLGRTDAAEAMAAAASRTLTTAGKRREGVLADMALARIHVQAGESRGLELAREAIRSVSQIGSAVARQCWLPPLVTALAARPEPAARDLARLARHIAA